jgi:diguanylate cyclase (GGDEF)-like protein
LSRRLRAYLDRPDTVINLVREAHASLDPQSVGVWFVREADMWLPAPSWSIVAPDLGGEPAVLAERGLRPEMDPSVRTVARWVMANSELFASGNLAEDVRAGQDAHGSSLAFPLVCRGRAVAALVALDPEVSAAAPSLSASLLSRLQVLLDLGAVALDNALTFRKEAALSITDDLTSLNNSRYLNEVLRREEKRAARTGRPLSVLFVDMDGFKAINTHHGHLAGSRALVEAATVIRSSARETDIVARFGGDEFALVLPDTDQRGANAVAERILQRLRTFEFLKGDGLALRLTASIGAATLPEAASSAEELLRAADRSMYRVKDTGGNGIHFAEKDS